MSTKCDVLIIGAGVVGLSTGIALLEAKPSLRIIILEKEKGLARHASGRNSGVIHAGFYYSPESLKAKFCKEGNFELRELAKKYGVPVKDVGKVVVSKNLEEDLRLDELFKRGIANNVEIEIHNKEKLEKFEPLATTHDRFILSPTTGISDSKAIIQAMHSEFLSRNGKVHFDLDFKISNRFGEISDSENNYQFQYLINAAGAQADRISRSVGVGNEYAMLPFMGVYRATDRSNLPLSRLVYPVPHPINPFLGVHFTLTVDGQVKIGPTAIPILGREQYSLHEGWSFSDTQQSLRAVGSLILGDSHRVQSIVKNEWPYLIQRKLIEEASRIVPKATTVKTWKKKSPGIRAQLVHLKSGELAQDFIVKCDKNALHILNAVSPGWTSSLPFGRAIALQILKDLA
jgi:L-2-hydroxyglutarate oxidase